MGDESRIDEERDMRNWQDIAELVIPGYGRLRDREHARYRTTRESAARSRRREDQRLTRGGDTPG
ncbi:hypothetical protein ACTI_42340 [Actinoplanes sp. OR16]|nr:hypothetical protein ACTI_42340 [Actinoplanes sp. OR16]